VWTTQEPDTRASRSGETALRGAEALEARSPSTAVPKRCRGARLLGVEAAEAAASTSGISVTRRELDPPKWGERRCRADRPPKWVAFSTVPFAHRRGDVRAAADCRLPKQVDVRRCRFVRTPKRPSASTAGMSGFPKEAGRPTRSLRTGFALTSPKQREARYVQEFDDTSHEVRAPSGEISSGDRCAGLPCQHHPLSGFLTLSAV
jgi:hypothetical protein